MRSCCESAPRWSSSRSAASSRLSSLWLRGRGFARAWPGRIGRAPGDDRNRRRGRPAASRVADRFNIIPTVGFDLQKLTRHHLQPSHPNARDAAEAQRHRSAEEAMQPPQKADALAAPPPEMGEQPNHAGFREVGTGNGGRSVALDATQHRQQSSRARLAPMRRPRCRAFPRTGHHLKPLAASRYDQAVSAGISVQSRQPLAQHFETCRVVAGLSVHDHRSMRLSRDRESRRPGHRSGRATRPIRDDHRRGQARLSAIVDIPDGGAILDKLLRKLEPLPLIARA